MKDIAVIYYAYLVGDWKTLVIEQLWFRLQESGLAEAAKELWFISSGTEEDGQKFRETVLACYKGD